MIMCQHRSNVYVHSRWGTRQPPWKTVSVFVSPWQSHDGSGVCELLPEWPHAWSARMLEHAAMLA